MTPDDLREAILSLVDDVSDLVGLAKAGFRVRPSALDNVATIAHMKAISLEQGNGFHIKTDIPPLAAGKLFLESMIEWRSNPATGGLHSFYDSLVGGSFRAMIAGDIAHASLKKTHAAIVSSLFLAICEINVGSLSEDHDLWAHTLKLIGACLERKVVEHEIDFVYLALRKIGHVLK